MRRWEYLRKSQQWILILVIVGIFGATLMLEIPHHPGVEGLGADSGLFAYYGQQILHGRLLYRDLWDEKPPGVYYVNAAALLLLGENTWAIWWLNVVWIATSASLLFLILSRLVGMAPAGLACLLFLLLAMYPGYFLGGNFTEVYALLPQVLAVGILANYLSSRKAGWVFALGAVTAAAFLFKPTYIALGSVAFLTGLFLDLCRKAFRGALLNIAAYAAGLALPLGLVALYWAANGVLQEAVFAIFTYNLLYAREGFSRETFDLTMTIFKSIPPISTAFIFSLASLAVFLGNNWRTLIHPGRAVVLPGGEVDRRARRVWVFAGVFAAIPLEIGLVAISGKNFGHYFLTPLPALAMACAYIFWEITSAVQISTRKTAWFALLVCTLTLAFFASTLKEMVVKERPTRSTLTSFWKYVFTGGTKPDELDQYILENSQPSQSVLVWSVHPNINFQTGRRSPTRYAFILPLLMQTPVTATMYQQFLQDLAADPPALIPGPAELIHPDPLFWPG